MKKARNQSVILLLLFSLFSTIGYSQTLSKEEILNVSRKNFPEAVLQLKSFLEIPNDGHFPEQIHANLKKCQELFAELEF
ncbi:MAG: hypothetical protein ACKVJF_05720, partial [Flavobacteriales bacterium]